MSTSSLATPTTRTSRSTAVLSAAGFLSFFDRFSAAPMLIVIAAQESIPVSEAAALLAAYSLAYALGQPLWGVLGDAIGRLRTVRITLFCALLASVASAIAPSMPLVFLARILCGLFMGALFPTVLTMIGDTVAVGVERGRAVSALQTTTALGTTVATVGAGAIAALTSWRLVPVLVAGAAVILLVALRQLPASSSAERPARRRIRSAFGPWPLALYLIALFDGALLLGVFSYIAPAVEDAGATASTAGLFLAGYGVAIIGCAQLTRWLLRRWTRTQIMGVGAACLVVAYGLAATGSIAALAAASALVGASNALLHSSLQAWATEITPEARATTVSLFSCALFLGSAIATFLIASVPTSGYSSTFAIAAVASILLGVVCVAGYQFWAKRAR